MTSPHKQCGAMITWARSPNDDTKWMPPMEYKGEGFWIDEDMVGHHVHIYGPHVCDPDEVAKWQDRLERIAEVTGDPEDIQRVADVDLRAARRQADQESARAAARKFTCPACDAKKNHDCVNRSKGKNPGAGKPTLWPHPARLALTDWYEQRG